MHYFNLNVQDWTCNTRHLTYEEQGIYFALICFYYDSEKPIPANPEKTALVFRKLSLENAEEKARQILREFFVLVDEHWHNLRADKEISAYHQKVASARNNGLKGGRPKTKKAKKTKPVILANPEETGSKANYELLTNNKKNNSERVLTDLVQLHESGQKNARALEILKKYKLTETWQPNPATWPAVAARAGIPAEIPPHVLTEFCQYWSGDLRTFTEGQWQGKLITQIKKNYSKKFDENETDWEKVYDEILRGET